MVAATGDDNEQRERRPINSRWPDDGRIGVFRSEEHMHTFTFSLKPRVKFMSHRPVDKAFIFEMYFMSFGRECTKSPIQNYITPQSFDIAQIHKTVLKDIIGLLSKYVGPKLNTHPEPR